MEERGNLRWYVKIQIVGRGCVADSGSVDVSLFRHGPWGEEESEFASLIYIQGGNNLIFSKVTETNSTTRFRGGQWANYGYIGPLLIREMAEL